MSTLARRAGLAALLLLLGACERSPAPAATVTPDAQIAPDALPPPITPPADGDGLPQPPSYEVAIATAAADRNNAKKKCAELPETELRTCEEQADAAFSLVESDLADLRGNQQ